MPIVSETKVETDIQRYHACLNEFVQGVLAHRPDDIVCIVLYGGLVRDGNPIPGWSDIDIIVVFENITKRSGLTLSHLLELTEEKFGIRIDLTQLDQRWLTDQRLLSSFYNSEVINALSMRPGVSRIIYGTLPHVSFSKEQERAAAHFYISHTLVAVRRYLLENAMRRPAQQDIVISVARVTRWVFSIIRASLRLFDVYVHPYGPSLDQVKVLFPGIDLTVPYVLLRMREAPTTIWADHSLFISIETFLEEYVTVVLRGAPNHHHSQSAG